MNWTERINAAVAYIETCLDGEVDDQRLARIAGCSIYNFQRLFSFIADKSLSQYIRERRLTQAALDVIGTDARLIDIALRYGYDSQDAFARAFRQFHGVLPSAARKEPVQLKSCPRIIFEHVSKGEKMMNYQIEKWPAFAVAGLKTTVRTDEVFQQVPGLWNKLWNGGDINKLFALLQQTDYRPAGILGVAVGGRGEGSEFVDYYQGVTTWVDAPDVKWVSAPEGMETVEFPEATWVIIEANGDPFEVIQPIHKRFYSEWLPTSGYRLADLPVIESYLTDNRQSVWIAVEKE